MDEDQSGVEWKSRWVGSTRVGGKSLPVYSASHTLHANIKEHEQKI